MKDMPEFYDHVEEEIEAEMKYLKNLNIPIIDADWIELDVKYAGAPTITDTITGKKVKASKIEYRIIDNKVEYRVHYGVES